MAAGVLSGLHGETSYRYRKFKSDAMMAVTVGATIVTLIPLFLVLGYLLTKGVTSLNWAFFTHMPAPVGEAGGGMANAIVGTLEVVGIACLIGCLSELARDFTWRQIAGANSPTGCDFRRTC